MGWEEFEFDDRLKGMKVKEKWLLIGLLIVASPLIFWRINEGFVAFTDELLFEEASYRMAFGSDELQMSRWNEILIPINDGKVWLEKAPLYFWMTAPLFWLFNLLKSIYPLSDGVMRNGEFIYPWIRRWWTDIAGVGVVLFVYGIARELFKSQDHKMIKPQDHLGLLAAYLLLASPLFLATTKSASLDMMATLWITGAVYFYIKITRPKNHKIIKPTNKYVILCGVFIGLGIMTRSFLALTPIALIITDQLISKIKYQKSNIQIKNQINRKGFLLIFLTTLLIVLPWHLYMLYLFKAEFLRTYLGFNVFQHAVTLTPGYENTEWWFYIPELIRQIPWLVPMLVGSALFIGYQKFMIKSSKLKTQSLKLQLETNRLNTDMDSRLPARNTTHSVAGGRGNDNAEYGNNKLSGRNNHGAVFLLIWLFLPLIVLSGSTTRHGWYLVQIMPPIAILMALLINNAYKAIKFCNDCQMTSYFSEVAFVSFTLAGILSVLITPNPSTPTIKALRWSKDNVPIEEPIYVYKQWFLPQTLLFHPKEVKVVDLNELSKVIDTQNTFVFIADMHKDEVLDVYPGLRAKEEFKIGKIYSSQ